MKRWTRQEDDILREVYTEKGSRACEKILGKSENAIRSRCARLGLLKTGSGGEGQRTWHKWTPEQDELLRQHYPNDTSHALERMLGASKRAISCRAVALGLRKSEAAKASLISDSQKRVVQMRNAKFATTDLLRHKGYIVVAFWDETTRRDYDLEDKASEMGIRIIPDGCDIKARI